MLEGENLDHDNYSDKYISDILSSMKTFAVVGASMNITRPSFFVLKYLLAKGYDMTPVNPGHAGKLLLDQTVEASVFDIERPIDVVDVFRNSDAAMQVTKDAIEVGAKVVWMQLGVRNDEAAKLAENAGLKVIMNRCPKIEYGRLSGEIGWMGVNSRVVSAARSKI